MKTVKLTVDGKKIDAVTQLDDDMDIDFDLIEENKDDDLEDTIEIPVTSGEDDE